MNQIRRWGLVALVACTMFVACESVAHAQAVAPRTQIHIDGVYGPFLPTDISVDGYKMDQLIDVLHWFMILLFVGWGAFFVYCLVKFRQRPGHASTNVLITAKPSKYLEIGIALFEAVLLFGFAVPVWGRVKSEFPTDNPFHVRVVGEQFAWNFQYPGPDGKFGKINPRLVDTVSNPLGLVRDDPDAKDDLVAGELHIPEGRPVIVEITSKDVIHSFFVPVLRVKQDAIPGMRIPIWFRTKMASAGVYEVACAQLCGNNHYAMRAIMRVEPQVVFDEWYKTKTKPAEEFKEE